MSTMKQAKLDFSATKRKGSGTATGKPKTSVVQPQASTSKENSTRPKATSDEKKHHQVVLPVKEEEDSSEDIEEFDDSPEELDEIKPAPTPTSTGRTTRSSSQKSTTTTTRKKSEETVEESSASHGTPKSTVLRPSNLKTEDVTKKVEANTQKIDELPHLNVNDPKYRRLYGETREKMGGLPMIHGEKQTKIHEILRVFDNSYEYGPCVGMTRRERWDRAHAMGLNPPEEIDEILKTKEGSTNLEFVNNVFHGQV